MCAFQYFVDEEELEQLDGVAFWVPEGIRSKSDIFGAYGVGLSAPNGYFGQNWDAFNDCLMDLQWIESPEIFIVHHGLPRLSHEDTAIYLDILQNAVMKWADEKMAQLHRLYPDLIMHRLVVFFPREAEGLVSSYVEQATASQVTAPFPSSD